MRRRKSRSPAPEEQPDNEPQSRARQGKSPKRKSRWRRFLLLFLIALLLVGFLLPILIAKTSLKQTALNWALKDFQGQVTVETASLNWFSPIQFGQLKATDNEGNPLFEIETVSTSRPLLAFLYSSDYGTFEIKQPTLHVQLRPNGSNLEDAISKLISSESSNTTAMPKLAINVVAGQAFITSTSSPRQWHVANLNANVDTTRTDSPLSAEVQCEFKHEGEAYGGLALATLVDPQSSAITFSQIDSAVNANNLPLALVAPLLQRFAGEASTDGYLTGEFQAKASVASGEVSLTIQQLMLDQASFVSKQLLGADSIAVQRLKATGALAVSGSKVSADTFKIESELGDVNINGEFGWQEITQAIATGNLPSSPFQMDGNIDIARVANMLPNTLQLHRDLKIESGQLTFEASTKVERESPRIVFNIDTANLRALRGGQAIAWQKPLRLVGTLTKQGKLFAIENVRCESDFLTASGNGSLENGKLTVSGDLALLLERAGQFVDFQGLKLAGKLDGNIGWKLAAANSSSAPGVRPVVLDGRVDLDGPVIEWPNLPGWNPQQLSIELQGNALPRDTGEFMIDRAATRITVGTEQLTANLSQPIENLWTTERWQFQCNATGNAGGWLAIIQNFAPLDGIQAAGNLELGCIATLDKNLLRFNQVQYEIENFGFEGYTMSIREPKLTGNANANYHLDTGLVSVANFSANAPDIAANTKDFVIELSDVLAYHGTIFFRGELNHVADWWHLSDTPESLRYHGAVQGNVELKTNEDGLLVAIVAAKAENFVTAALTETSPQQGLQQVSALRKLTEYWREKLVHITSTFHMDADYNAVRFDSFDINGESLSANGHGSITDLGNQMVLDIQGNWQPDWKVFNKILLDMAGDLAKFSGNRPQLFSVKGPLYPSTTDPSAALAWINPQLEIRTGIGWESADLFKLSVGASQIGLDLSNSIARINVDQLPLSSGLVTLAPTIDLRGESPILVMQQGTFVNDLNLTADTCREYLKYVAPLVADATSAQGKFSISTGGIQIPIFDPMNLKAQGAIRLDQVTIGAGPLAEQLLGTAQQIRAMLKPNAQAKDLSTWLRLGKQDVPVAIQDKRVYHKDLTITYKDVVMKTSGSVGLDQTINLVAEVPILDEWVANDKWLAGLKGQSIKIPIGGTLTKPSLDKRVIQQLSQQLAKQAAGSALNNLVNDKLGVDPGNIQGVINDKIGNELKNTQEKLQDKLESELIKGLDGLFKKRGGQ